VISLFEDILNSGLGLRTQVTGVSMTPFLRGGEILTIKKVGSSSLRIGDLIFFKDRRGCLILHRIIKKSCLDGRFTFHTKGDAVSAFDEPVHENDVLGKVFGIEKIVSGGNTKYIDMESYLRKRINYINALSNLFKSKTYFAVLRLCKVRDMIFP
jgi:signal peptidase I